MQEEGREEGREGRRAGQDAAWTDVRTIMPARVLCAGRIMGKMEKRHKMPLAGCCTDFSLHPAAVVHCAIVIVASCILDFLILHTAARCDIFGQ